MKFLTRLLCIMLFLCYSSTTYGQFANQVILELDEIFYDANYNQYALPVAYESATTVFSVDFSLDFDTSKMQINAVIVSPEGSADFFNVNYGFPNQNRLQAAAYTSVGSQTTVAIMYILFDKYTNDDISPSDISNIDAYINQSPADTKIIAPDCVVTNEFGNEFEVHLLSSNCDSTINPILTFDIIGNNPNMPYTISAVSQITGNDATVNPNMLMGNGTFQVTFNNILSPNGEVFSFVIENADGRKVTIDKPIFPCAAPDPCIASGGELTGEGKIIIIKGNCPNFISDPVQNEDITGCSGGIERLYLLLDTHDYIQAASPSVNFYGICGLTTEQYQAVHYIQCATDRPTQDIYGLSFNNPNALNTINPYTDLAGGCKALSSTVRHRVLRFSEQVPNFGNDGVITCLNNEEGISDEFFEGLNFAWSHNANLNSGEATNLGFGVYNLTITWNDASFAQPIDTVLHFSLQPPLAFSVQAALSTVYDEAAGGMTSNYFENQLLPYQQVFGQAPWYYDGTETIINPDNTIIDWLLLEARDAEDNFAVAERQAVLLLDDGRVVGANDFDENLKFYELSPNKAYHLSIKARNHVGAMTAQSYFFGDNPEIDFRDYELVLDGFNQLQMMPDGLFGLRGGDYDGDGVVTIADFNIYLQQEGAVNVYAAADANCDGEVTETDLNIYLNNSGQIGVVPIRY